MPNARDQIAIWCISTWFVALGFSLLPRLLFGTFLSIEPLHMYPSPDGKWILATYYLCERAPGERDFWVHVRPAGTHLIHRQDNIVAVTEYANAIDVTWELPTKATVTFVSGFSYGSSHRNLHIRNQQVGEVQVEVKFIEQPEITEEKVFTSTDMKNDISTLAKIFQHQSGTPTGWKTVLELARVTKESASTNAKFSQVLTVDGKYDAILAEVSADSITLTLPAAAHDAELTVEPQLLDLPIHVVYGK